MCMELGTRVTFKDTLHNEELHNALGTVTTVDAFVDEFEAVIKPNVSHDEASQFMLASAIGVEVFGADVFVRLDRPLESEFGPVAVVQIHPDMVTVD